MCEASIELWASEEEVFSWIQTAAASASDRYMCFGPLKREDGGLSIDTLAHEQKTAIGVATVGLQHSDGGSIEVSVSIEGPRAKHLAESLMAGLREIAEAEGALEQSRLGRPAEWARVTVPAYLVEVADWLDRWATETARDAFIDVGGVKVTLGRPDRPDQWSISQRLVVNVHSTDDKSLLEYELIRRGYRVSASGEVERSLDDLEIVARLAKRDADSPRARVDIGADGIESVDLAKRLLQEIGRRWDCAIEATHLEAERRKDRPHVFEGLPEQPTPEWFPRTEAKQKLWRRKADIMRRMDEEYLGLYEHGEINCATPTTSDYATRLLEQTEDTHNSAETLRNIRKARRMGLI